MKYLIKKVLLVFLFILFYGFSFSLKISEVYYDGSKEFIGIFNDTGKLFSGEITLSGAKKSNINIFVSIIPYEEIIIGDDSDILSGYSFYKTGLGLSISDTNILNIDLLSGNEILDDFYVSGDIVKKFNNKLTSFEKIYSGGNWLVQDVKTGINVSALYKANPGYVYGFSFSNITLSNQNSGSNNFTGQFIKIESCNINLKSVSGSIYNFIYTGNFNIHQVNWYINNNYWTSGNSMSISLSSGDNLIKGFGKDFSGNICTGNFFVSIREDKIIENIFTGKLVVNEIHSKKDSMNEFVELKAIGNISGTYLFSGFLSSTKNFSLNLKLYSGNILVIAKNYSGFLYTGNIILQPLSLKDSGEKLQIIKSGEIVDSVFYSLKQNLDESLYFSEYSGNIRLFDTIKNYTPGYENYIIFSRPALNLIKSCNIVLQSQEIKNTKLKINFTNDLDSKYCGDSYRQIWTYSGQVLTGKCNPSFFYLNTGNQNINFKLEDLSGNILCEDSYKILYLQKEQEKVENLNCYIKIQSKTDSFLAKDKVNFITVVNNKEVQNSNTNYICKYFLSGTIISDKCNPNSMNLTGGLNIIDLEVMSNNGLTCQTKYYLNLPKESEKIITKVEKESINYINCAKLNSNELKILVENIMSKYKTNTTLKKIFSSVEKLFKENKDTFVKKSNSDKLKNFVEQIDKKYKSKTTLKKIFSPISYLYENKVFSGNDDVSKLSILTGNNFYTGINLKIVGLLPNPIGADKNKELVLLSGSYKTGIYIQTTKKIYLENYTISGGNLLFTGSFSLKNLKGCVNLGYGGNILDRKCYNNVKEGKIIKSFVKNIIEEKFTKISISFSGENIILSNGQVFKNKKFIRYKKKIASRLKKFLKNIFKTIKKLKKENKKIRKINLDRTVKYVLLKAKLNKIKQSYKQKDKSRYKKLKTKILEIKNLNRQTRQKNNTIYFLKSFIRKVKKHIDKDIYKQYLDDYKKVENGQRIRY